MLVAIAQVSWVSYSYLTPQRPIRHQFPRRQANQAKTSSISSQSQLRGYDEQSIINDQLRVFEAIEGTPLNFSTATSFSDLTVDDVDPTDGRISRDPDDGLLQIHSNKNFSEPLMLFMPMLRLHHHLLPV